MIETIFSFLTFIFFWAGLPIAIIFFSVCLGFHIGYDMAKDEACENNAAHYILTDKYIKVFKWGPKGEIKDESHV